MMVFEGAAGMGALRREKNDIARNCDPGCHTAVVGSRSHDDELIAYG